MTDKPDLKVVNLNPNNKYPDIKEVIKDIMNRVEKGEVIGIACALLQIDRSIGTVFTEGIKDHCFTALGAIETLKFRILTETVETR